MERSRSHGRGQCTISANVEFSIAGPASRWSDLLARSEFVGPSGRVFVRPTAGGRSESRLRHIGNEARTREFPRLGGRSRETRGSHPQFLRNCCTFPELTVAIKHPLVE